MSGLPSPDNADGPGGGARGGMPAGRAVVWTESGVAGDLERLLDKRGLRPERVDSAPALLHAVLRPGAASAAVILVEPAGLVRACEVVEVLQRPAVATRCWRFEPPPAGPGGAGLLEPINGPLRLDTPFRLGAGIPAPPTPGPASSARERLSRAELAMLLGPTRTLASSVGDAG